jgi:hypothetical protein
MAQSSFAYRIHRNGKAGDWHWEVISGGRTIARGLASTDAKARAGAMIAAISQPDQPSEGWTGIRKTTTPRSSSTEM